MSRPLIILVGLIYAYIAFEMAMRKSPQAIVYAGYAFSNVGLWLLAD
ncbi:hypothetical protein SAMN05444159_1238 [Bradyrhizobium lablabi]|uniref:Uncharacterized protein n=1 Tax=Bradyrhizobium lablabi TaxID=722472 RepID=A0A1M6LCN0_9BRAD|nr:hypothetical protein [Bradyrhizobium lablabi]SHJ68926.1 hypothetical protein SAMN05444159_1238 [Bradyrhizobium lablabi]